MRKIDEMYLSLIKQGYEPMYLQSLTDKELRELYKSQQGKGGNK